MKKIIAALGLAGMLVPVCAGAADIFEKVGTFDGQFLKIEVGARAAAMGGAFVGVSDDATALFWNAAGIARIDPAKSEITFNHAFWPADLNFSQAGYVFHLKRFPGAFGLQFRSLYMNPMDETTAFQPNGTGNQFDAGMMATGVTYARSFTDKFSAGGTANYIHEGLADLSQHVLVRRRDTPTTSRARCGSAGDLEHHSQDQVHRSRGRIPPSSASGPPSTSCSRRTRS